MEELRIETKSTKKIPACVSLNSTNKHRNERKCQLYGPMQRQGAYFILVVTMRDNLELLDTETLGQRDSVTPQLKIV